MEKRRPPESLPPPKEIADKPELLLCWRGLSISISEGQMTHAQAQEMLRTWEGEGTPELPADLHDTGPNNEPAA